MKRVLNNALQNALLAIISVVVFFVAFEGLVRVIGPDLSMPKAAQQFQFTQDFEFELPHHTRDAVLGWRLVPGAYGPMRINAQGFRGRESTQAAADGTRIAHLGDSCTMGFTIAADRDIYSSRVELLLSKQQTSAQTFNFGVDGYSSHQGRLLLPEVLRELQPKYVTLYFGYNDHHWSNVSDRQATWQNPVWRTTFEKSHAYRYLRRQLLRASHQEARLVQPQRRVSLEHFAENLRYMVTAARSAGSEPLLLTTPLRPGIPLVENEVLTTIQGEQRWVTQEWWVQSKLQEKGMTLKSSSTPQYVAVIKSLIAEHPDWPLPHWFLARELQRQGDTAGMRREMSLVQKNDQERVVMQGYNDAVRHVADVMDVVLVDLARQFPRQPGLFNDVVHPSAQGHQLIATLLAESIRQLEAQHK